MTIKDNTAIYGLGQKEWINDEVKNSENFYREVYKLLISESIKSGRVLESIIFLSQLNKSFRFLTFTKKEIKDEIQRKDKSKTTEWSFILNLISFNPL